ncbi:hypothetical protein [Enterococcus olivae]
MKGYVEDRIWMMSNFILALFLLLVAVTTDQLIVGILLGTLLYLPIRKVVRTFYCPKKKVT